MFLQLQCRIIFVKYATWYIAAETETRRLMEFPVVRCLSFLVETKPQIYMKYIYIFKLPNLKAFGDKPKCNPIQCVNTR